MKQRKRLERVEERRLTEATTRRAIRTGALHASAQLRARSLMPEHFAGSEVDLAARMSGRRHIERTDRQIAAQRAALEHSNRELEEARERLLERRRDRRALETLLDRELKAEAHRRERHESLHLDEVAASRWNRAASTRKGA